MKEELPVILNVYKLTESSFLYKIGITIYHTAIEFDNNEFAFGSTSKEKFSGVYDIKPMSFDDGIFVESIIIGTSSRRNFFVNLEKLKAFYIGNTYNFIMKNCNHFTNDFSKTLFHKEIPKKYRSFLKFGEFLRKIF
jgi:hypothetical protein